VNVVLEMIVSCSCEALNAAPSRQTIRTPSLFAIRFTRINFSEQHHKSLLCSVNDSGGTSDTDKTFASAASKYRGQI
jgi:hypothetical protein